MSDSKFKVGDVVELKSGGPRMTVQSVEEDGTTRCLWFVANELKSGSFPQGVLDESGHRDRPIVRRE
jgi:uncharacterized protein YodC (DUF2158 family)